METVVITIGVIGLLISFFNLPGQWFVFVGSFIAYFNHSISIWLLIAYLVLAIVASVADNLFMLWGTKKYGGSWWGMLGAFVGLIIGAIIGNFFGAIVGPFIGAYIFETTFAKKDSEKAFKAGIGTIIGLAGGILVKAVITGFMLATLIAVIK